MDKRCVGCMDILPRAQFYRCKNTDDNLNRYCKHCCKVNRAMEAVRKRDKKSKISFRQIYRAKQLGVEYDDTIKLVDVFKKDAGMCGICGKWVVPKKASMDHIKPLVDKGSHTMPNLQLTHLLCNLKKGART